MLLGEPILYVDIIHDVWQNICSRESAGPQGQQVGCHRVTKWAVRWQFPRQIIIWNYMPLQGAPRCRASDTNRKLSAHGGCGWLVKRLTL